jgi:hypothetical protein
LGERPEKANGGKDTETTIPRRHDVTPIPPIARGKVQRAKLNRRQVQDTGGNGYQWMLFHPNKHIRAIVMSFPIAVQLWHSGDAGELEIIKAVTGPGMAGMLCQIGVQNRHDAVVFI